MIPYCLDTSAYAEFRRGNEEVTALIDSARYVTVPAVVVGELLGGFKLGSRELENTDGLWEFLANPATDIQDVDESVALHYAGIFSNLRTNGTPIPTNDMWIAASAMSDGSTVLSCDGHFEKVPGLRSVIVEPVA